MSTAHSSPSRHERGERDGGKGHRSHRRHPVRNTLLILIALAALVLWQLPPVLHGLAAVQTGLRQAEGTRSVLAAFIHLAISQIRQWAGPVVAHMVR